MRTFHFALTLCLLSLISAESSQNSVVYSRDMPSYYYVAKGRSNDECTESGGCETAPAIEDETHAVRCCRSEALEGWSRNDGCNVWAESDVWDEGCQELTWSEADTFCKNQNARLCTVAELEGDCAKLTGCQFDYRLIWSSDYYADADVCPPGYTPISENLRGEGQLFAQPDLNRTIFDCADICDSREGCTGFEFAEGIDKACSTYTGGQVNIQNEENRLLDTSTWISCIKHEQLCLYSQLSVTEAVVSAPFIIVDGEYAIVPEDAGNGGEIIFSIYCSEATSGVRFEAYSLGDHGGNDSFYVQFDDSEQIEWHLNRSNSWIWQEITQSKDKLEWSVDAIIGEHTFKIMQREDGTKIQSLRFLSGHDSCSFQASCDQTSSKVINYEECITINSRSGPHHEFEPENWNTKCPENTAVVSVETKDLEAHNGSWTIVKMQCCALVDKITQSHYRLPEMHFIEGKPNYLQGGGSSSVEDQWEAQCASNAIMVGIYDNDDSGDFDDIDAAKCNTLECPYTCGEKIDSHDCVVIDLSPASLSSCPIDYVMVGLWDHADSNFDRVQKMKCCRVLESILPTVSPTQMPTTDEPSECPTVSPTTSIPSMSPTTNDPTIAPSTDTPTKSPSQNPTTEEPSAFPTKFPTYAPTLCEPTCRSHADQLVNVLGRLLDFNTQLLRVFEPNHPLKNVLNEMILDVERLKDQMNNVHDDMSIFPLVH